MSVGRQALIFESDQSVFGCPHAIVINHTVRIVVPKIVINHTVPIVVPKIVYHLLVDIKIIAGKRVLRRKILHVSATVRNDGGLVHH